MLRQSYANCAIMTVCFSCGSAKPVNLKDLVLLRQLIESLINCLEKHTTWLGARAEDLLFKFGAQENISCDC
jgi:hypothetical protein